MRVCHLHPPRQLRDTEWCPRCFKDWTRRKPADDLTSKERLAEFDWWCSDEGGGILEIPFEKVQQRLHELIGRKVWTHELAGEENRTALRREIRTGIPATPQEILARAANHQKQTIVVEVPDAETQDQAESKETECN